MEETPAEAGNLLVLYKLYIVHGVKRVLLPCLKPIYFSYSFCVNLEIDPMVMHYHAFGFMHAVCMALSIGEKK